MYWRRSVLRILEWTIPAYDRLGTVRSREGNRLSNSAPLDNYASADGRYVCVVAGSDANFARLCRAMGRSDLPDDPRFASLADRAAHGDLINGIVADWVAARTAAEVERACVDHDVPVATAYTARDIVEDTHIHAQRHDLIPNGRSRSSVPCSNRRPIPTDWGGRERAGRHPRAPGLLGQRTNREVWCGAPWSGPLETYGGQGHLTGPAGKV